MFGECGANIMSQILEKLKVNSLQVEVKRERSDIENYHSKIRKFRIQEGIINYLEQMYIVAVSNMHMGHSFENRTPILSSEFRFA